MLVPGAGYGRNTKALSSAFKTYGVELSPSALALAAEWDPDTVFIGGSALEPHLNEPVDAVYCYDVLHLFLAAERQALIDSSLRQLRPHGLLYFTSFSDEDSNAGQGRILEPGTYEYKSGKYAHFFSDNDLREHFAETDIRDTGSFRETLADPGGGSHDYMLRYIVARKR